MGSTHDFHSNQGRPSFFLQYYHSYLVESHQKNDVDNFEIEDSAVNEALPKLCLICLQEYFS